MCAHAWRKQLPHHESESLRGPEAPDLAFLLWHLGPNATRPCQSENLGDWWGLVDNCGKLRTSQEHQLLPVGKLPLVSSRAPVPAPYLFCPSLPAMASHTPRQHGLLLRLHWCPGDLRGKCSVGTEKTKQGRNTSPGLRPTLRPWLRSTREPRAPRRGLRPEVDGPLGEEEVGPLSPSLCYHGHWGPLTVKMLFEIVFLTLEMTTSTSWDGSCPANHLTTLNATQSRHLHPSWKDVTRHETKPDTAEWPLTFLGARRKGSVVSVSLLEGDQINPRST